MISDDSSLAKIGSVDFYLDEMSIDKVLSIVCGILPYPGRTKSQFRSSCLETRLSRHGVRWPVGLTGERGRANRYLRELGPTSYDFVQGKDQLSIQ